VTDQTFSLDSIQDDTAGVCAVEADGEHVAVTNPEANSRALVGDKPLQEETVAVWLDDDRATIRASIRPRSPALVDAG
jgi:hypothetical protein